MLGRLDRVYLALFREHPYLVRLAVITGAGQVAFALVNVYALPVYLVENLHVSGLALGAASATFLICEMALKYPMGKLSDRYGRRAFIGLGPLLICLNPTIIASLPTRLWGLVFPVRAADGVGAAALWPPLFALVGDTVEDRSRAAAMSVVNAVYVGAIGAAAALGAFSTYASGNDRFPFYLASALLAVSGGVGLLGLRDRGVETRAPRTPSPPEADAAGAKPAGAPPALGRVMLISLLMTLGVLMLPSFLVLYLKARLALSNLHIGILLVALGLPVVLLGLPLGHVADRWGKRRAVRLSLALSAVMMGLVPLCRSLPLFLAVGLILVLGHILGTPAWLALVSEIAPAGRRGGVMAIVATAEGAGAALGPLLGGWLWDINPSFIFYGSGILLALAAVVAAAALPERGPA